MELLPLMPRGWAFRLASRIGRRRLRAMIADGLPPCLHPPLQFLLGRTLDPTDYRVIREIERLRADMARRTHEVVGVFRESTDYRLEQARSGQPSGYLRSLPYLAAVSSVLPQWGMFLYLCANALGAKTILELGSGAGISGCYLAWSSACRRFISVEGDPARARLARLHLQQVTDRCELFNASFDEALDRILPTVGDGIDLAYIDGNKDKAHNLHYLERIVPYLNRESVVIFDDIHWSPEMRDMWWEAGSRPGFSHTVNAGRFGVGVWTGGPGRPKIHSLYQLASIDLFEVKQCLERLKGVS